MRITPQERKSLVEILKQNSRIQNGCWNWLRGRDKNGYGLLKVRRKTVRVNRLAYAVFNGDFDDNWHVLHRCDNPACINPDHLWLGTNADNVADRCFKGRELHYTGDQHWTHVHPEYVARGERQGSAKLTDDKVRQIFHLRSEGFTLQKIGDLTGVTKAHVGRIVRGESWNHLQLPKELN